MKNKAIAETLKLYRKHNQLTVKDVATQLKEHSISAAEKTIYGWENGQSQPDADTFLILCEIYHISDILGAFGYKKTENINLTQTEKDIVLGLRKHHQMIDAVKKLVDVD